LEKIRYKNADFWKIFHQITIMERVLTGKLLTSKLPTGIFSTDKVSLQKAKNG
jgi:hypothetical protein